MATRRCTLRRCAVTKAVRRDYRRNCYAVVSQPTRRILYRFVARFASSRLFRLAVAALLAAGVDVNARNKDGSTGSNDEPNDDRLS